MDYRSPVDIRNDKDLSFGSTVDKVNQLSQLLQQQDQPFRQAQAQAQLQQILGKQKASAQQEELAKAKQAYQDLNKGSTPLGGKQGVKVGDTSIESSSPSPYAYMGKLGEEAQKVDSISSKKLKPFGDQLNAAKQTLDYLDQGNPSADKLALISEAQLAAGSGGSRAIKSIVDTISGGTTSNQDYQHAMNWLNNSKDIPEMQPSQRNALRETVLGRMPAVQQQYNQVKQQLSQQIPQFATMHQQMGQTKPLIESTFGPTDDLVNDINKRNTAYMQSKVQQQIPPLGQPSVATPQPSNIDKLKSMFGFGPKQPQQQSPQQPAQQGSNSATLRVREKASGKTGSLPVSEFDPNLYDKVQ